MIDDDQIDGSDPTLQPATGPGPGVLGVVVLPGIALWRRRPIPASLLFAVGVIAPAFGLLLVFQHRDDVIGLLTRTDVLRGLSLVAVGAIASRFVAVWLTSDLVADDFHRRRMRVAGSSIVLALCLPTALVVVRMQQASDVVETVFQDSPTAGSVAVAEPAVDPYEGQFQTVLLLGSDEGTDRIGLRTDSMILAIIHEETGRTALVSVPRNMVGMRFPPDSPLGERYPDGYEDDEDGLINAIYNTVENDPDLAEQYETPTTPAGIQALMEAISYSFGITIDDYLMINSCGFVKVVDAIGGVTITLDKELPMPSKMKCSNYRLTPTIGPGETFMDGTKALGYVRSRTADSDYQRMERQRLLLQTIIDEVGFRDLLSNFGELAGAVEDNVHTTMTVDEARTLLSVLQQNGDQELDSIGLVPPLYHPNHPDLPALRTILQDIRRSLAEGTPLDLPTETVPDDTSG